jgi:ubiquinone/menaquinone biosynthesis C-methylase UbiE
MIEKTVLDVCCGSRMFYFDKTDDRVLFCDIRQETAVLNDKTAKDGVRSLVISPDVVGDFRKLEFPDESFPLVVFDPPHLKNLGGNSWLAKKYGKLGDTWKEDISAGFRECFRVLKINGTLIFKWNETDIPVSQILALTDEKPVFGNRSGKAGKTHWIVFQKTKSV